MTLRAVDLSHVKTITNWDALCGYANILIFKATEGSPEGTKFLDPMFASRLAEARRRGKLIGVYHYVGSSVAKRVYSAASEADWFAANYDHRPGEVPIADYEPANPPADPDGWLAAFHGRLTAKGWPVPMTYMNTGAAAANSWAKVRGRSSALWVARYFANNGQVPAQQPSPGPFGAYAMWQYTSNGAVPGVTGSVDVSLFYGTADQWRAYGGADAPSPSPTPTVQEDDMRLVRSNDTGGVWLISEFSMQPVPDQATYQAYLDAGIPAAGVSQGEIDVLSRLTDARRKQLLDDMQSWVLGANPGTDPQQWLFPRLVALGDTVTKLQSGGLDVGAVAAAIVAKLPATPAAASGLTRDDVKAAVRDFFAEAAQQQQPTS